MRIRFDHPAVITGHWENGHIRRELVRVPAEFEIHELSDEEAPRSFTVLDDASGATIREYRCFEGRHYKRWDLDKTQGVFKPESHILNSVYSGIGLDFPGLADILKDEINKVRKISDYRDIENTDRQRTKKETVLGLDSRSVALMKAPMLKRWRWVGGNVNAEVDDWRNRTAEVFNKFILVNGQAYTLTFEPCYRVNASGTTENRTGLAQLSSSTVAVYGKDVRGPVHDTQTGFEKLGLMGLILGDQYFSANDRDTAVQFAEYSGWGLNDKGGETIVVHNEAMTSDDFMELETIRHAYILYDRASLMVGRVRHVDGRDQYSGRYVDKEEMVAGLENLRHAILEWQTARDGTDNLASPFESILAEMMRWEEGSPKINTFDLIDQIKAFKVREDMAVVKITPRSWGAPHI
jgi:hypothetical protein